MTFYNDFTPLTLTATSAAVILLLAGAAVRRIARDERTRSLGGGALGAAAAIAIVTVAAVSWQGWALALGPLLATLPLVGVALLGVLAQLSTRSPR